ncbi:MAG: peptide ABC transporter permease, partial [Allgaiera sp.]|nr:peptide ABC transporter permease [Allgaiera sp.]
MRLFLRLLWRNRLASLGGGVITVIVLLALVTPLLPLQHPDVTDTAHRFLFPFSKGHLLGTDQLG